VTGKAQKPPTPEVIVLCWEGWNMPMVGSMDKFDGVDKPVDKTQKILLNLVYDYPVRWSQYKVLRDFVQNFYDSIGYREWNSRFQ
jgi:hypothetical protein